MTNNNNNKKEIILETMGMREDTKMFKRLLASVLDDLVKSKFPMIPEEVVVKAILDPDGEIKVYQKMCNVTDENLEEYAEEYVDQRCKEDTKMFRRLLTSVLDNAIQMRNDMSDKEVVDRAINDPDGEIKVYQKMCNVTDRRLASYARQYLQMLRYEREAELELEAESKISNGKEVLDKISDAIVKGNASIEFEGKLSINITAM